MIRACRRGLRPTEHVCRIHPPWAAPRS
jgi:hypothetical protein